MCDHAKHIDVFLGRDGLVLMCDECDYVEPMPLTWRAWAPWTGSVWCSAGMV